MNIVTIGLKGRSKLHEYLQKTGDKTIKKVLDSYGDLSLKDAREKLNEDSITRYLAKKYEQTGDATLLEYQLSPIYIPHLSNKEIARNYYEKNPIDKKVKDYVNFIKKDVMLPEDVKTYKTSELEKIARIWLDNSNDQYLPYENIPAYKTKGISKKTWDRAWQSFEG